jgi:hypothetical protein
LVAVILFSIIQRKASLHSLESCWSEHFLVILGLKGNTHVENRSLARHKVTVVEYFDGTVKIKCNSRELSYRTYDKIKKIDQGQIVSNKRLGAVLSFIKEKQDKIDEKRSTSAPSKQHLGEVSTAVIRNASKKIKQLSN